MNSQEMVTPPLFYPGCPVYSFAHGEHGVVDDTESAPHAGFMLVRRGNGERSEFELNGVYCGNGKQAITPTDFREGDTVLFGGKEYTLAQNPYHDEYVFRVGGSCGYPVVTVDGRFHTDHTAPCIMLVKRAPVPVEKPEATDKVSIEAEVRALRFENYELKVKLWREQARGDRLANRVSVISMTPIVHRSLEAALDEYRNTKL